MKRINKKPYPGITRGALIAPSKIKKNKPGQGRPAAVWTKEKVSEFKKLYKTTSQRDLAKRFNVTLRSIKGLASKLNVKKRARGWSKNDDLYLLKNWNTHTKNELSMYFGKTRSAINRRFKNLN